MVAEGFDLWIEVRRGGEVLEAARANASACLEDALFRGVLGGRFANDGLVPKLDLAPEIDPEHPPAATALVLSCPEAPPVRYPRAVFALQARHLIQSLVRAKRLAPKAPVAWALVARPREAASAPAARVTRAPFPLTPQPLPGSPAGSLGIEMEAHVLEAIQRAVVEAKAVERAGLLLGWLLHDAAREAAVLRLGAEIPVAAGEGGASEVHFAFGAASFLEARRAAAGREDGAVPAGWWHSHPPCASCSSQPRCQADLVFFSTRDREVHATAFPRAFAVALVAGKVRHLPAGRPGFRMYGWSGGSIQRRPLEVVGPGAEAFRAELGSSGEGEVGR